MLSKLPLVLRLKIFDFLSFGEVVKAYSCVRRQDLQARRKEEEALARSFSRVSLDSSCGQEALTHSISYASLASYASEESAIFF